mgnify:CR=1 FL=1
MATMFGKNKHGDTVLVISEDGEDLVVNYSYWNCDCADHFVKPMKLHHCNECGADRDDSEISEEVEVQFFIYQNEL